jgi:predicted ABC-type ATPase
MAREGLVAVEQDVTRGGSTHKQRFWIRTGVKGVAKEIERSRKATDVEQLARFKQLGEGRFKKLFPASKKGTEEHRRSLAKLRSARALEQHLDSEGRLKIPEGRVWVDRAPGLPEETWREHWEQGANAKALDPSAGNPKPERVATVHKKILDKAFETARPYAPGEQKVAIVTMGAPASGKSSIVGDVVDERWVRVDPDAIKEQLPEYETAIEAGAKNAAKMAHEESSYLARQIRGRAIAEGYPVMIDGTGRNAKSHEDLIDKLHAHGYEVHLVMADLDEETGIARMKARAEDVGRYVPDNIVIESYRTIPGNFERIAQKADTFRLFDTRGASAKLVWSRDEAGSPEMVHDEERVAEFKARAESQRWLETSDPMRAPLASLAQRMVSKG